jgi:hypothetical protein
VVVTSTGLATDTEGTAESPDPEPTAGGDSSSSPLPTPGAGDDTLVSPLPSPAVVVPTIDPTQLFQVPTPSSEESGVITGYLLGGEKIEPLSWVVLYLGEVIELDDGTPLLTAFSQTTAPSSGVDPEGRFVFIDVPAGMYGLVVDRITSTAALRNPETGDSLLIEVKGGDVIDLGELVYPEFSVVP